MFTRISALWRQALLLCLGGSAALLVGCGGDDSATGPSTTPSTIASAPVTNVIGSVTGESLQPGFLVYYPFTTPASGTIGVTVDWTLATSDLDVFLARGTTPCTAAQFNSRQCPLVGSAESKTAKPERLSVPDQAAGSYILYIGNYGNTQESLSFQLTLTTVAGTRAVPAPRVTGGAKGAISGTAVLR